MIKNSVWMMAVASAGCAFGNSVPGFCDADINQDGTVSPTDFGAWLAAFNAGDPIADANMNGSVEPTDFGAFLANLNLGNSGPGCPAGAGSDLVVIFETQVGIDYDLDDVIGTDKNGSADDSAEAISSTTFNFIGETNGVYEWSISPIDPGTGFGIAQEIFYDSNELPGEQWSVIIDEALWPDATVGNACFAERSMPQNANDPFPALSVTGGLSEFGIAELPNVVQGDLADTDPSCPGIPSFDWDCDGNGEPDPCYEESICMLGLGDDDYRVAVRLMRVYLKSPGSIVGLGNLSSSFWVVRSVSPCD